MGKSEEGCAEAGEGEGENDWNSECWLERAFKDRWEGGEGVGRLRKHSTPSVYPGLMPLVSRAQGSRKLKELNSINSRKRRAM